ncbi:leucine-rich repeat-containing protein 57-like [Polyodon spathula]|uniref:leucine-rich repeat-containing protein 57-like n=1 Tax=Polyodon spathula TaxID=7913 RepID=UPI001B7F2134|nr:leucine-rich repeat-containing protein 57-like [Polyodon spathula]
MNLISLPSSLRKLRQLQKTGARNNHIATLPTEFVQLKALQWLNLANNELSDLPKNFMNLEVLAYLNLDGNTFLESLSDRVPGIKKSSIKNKKREEARMAPHNQANLREQSVVQPPTSTVALPEPSIDHRVTPSSDISNAGASSGSQGKPSLRRIKGRIHRSKSLDSIELLDSNVVARQKKGVADSVLISFFTSKGMIVESYA